MSRSARSSFPSFPPEILEEIINQLDGQLHASTLASCALASRIFRAPAQKRVFTTISLDYICDCLDIRIVTQAVLEDDSCTGHIFLDFIRRNPSVATLVREIRIIFIQGPWEPEDEWPPERLHMASFSALLPLLPNLQKVSFPGGEGEGLHSDWCWIPGTIKDYIAECLRRSTTKSMDLSSLILCPTSLLNGCSQLKHLAILPLRHPSKPGAIEMNGPPVHCPDFKAVLQSLIIRRPEERMWRSSGSDPADDWRDFMQWIVSPQCTLDLTSLTSLSIVIRSDGSNHGSSREITRDEILDLEALFAKCSMSLEDLTLTASKNVHEEAIFPGRNHSVELEVDDRRIQAPSLAQIRHLKSLTLETNIIEPEYEEDNVLYLSPQRWIVDILNSVQDLYILSRATLILNLVDFPEIELPKAIDWGVVSSVFLGCDPAQLSKRRMELRFKYVRFAGDREEHELDNDFIQEMKSGPMAHLIEAGVVSLLFL